MNPLLLVDAYKVNHYNMYPKGMTQLYSNLTPRKSRMKGVDGVVFFGLQHFCLEYLIEEFNKKFFCFSKEERVDISLKNIEIFKNSIIKEYQRHCPVDTKHIESLWNLGYLPIEIKALKEGTICPIGVPCLTITNTHPNFAWLVNYLETLISCMIWQPITSATIAHEYKKLLNKYALETTGSTEGVQWQGHDFSMRGMSSPESAVLSAMGHLLSFTGTDTVPAIYQLEESYHAVGLIGASVPATEHSVMCMGEKESEVDTFKRLLDLYPAGILSVVSDTWDLWKVCTEYLPELKEQILARDGKLVIRPDSGDPVDIICGTISKKTFPDLTKWYKETDSPINHPLFFEDILLDEVIVDTPHGEQGVTQYETTYKIDGRLYKVKIHNISWNRYDKQYYYIDMWEKANITVKEVLIQPAHKGVIELLWDIFGGTVNWQGYKVLNSHIGAIYGDSITLERAEQICERLKEKGFASTNIVLGIGSYTYQYNTRDTFGFAMKATYGEVFNQTMYNEIISKNNGVITALELLNCTDCKEIFKDPITDDGTKKSKKGLLCVTEAFSHIDGVIKNLGLICTDQQTWKQEQTGLLQTVFKDSKMIRTQTLTEIRELLNQ